MQHKCHGADNFLKFFHSSAKKHVTDLYMIPKKIAGELPSFFSFPYF